MKIKDWMIPILIAALGFAVGYGKNLDSVGNLNTRVTKLETFQDDATSELGQINGKLDILLSYHKK
ncbi:MAG: hypothetical protein KGI58_04155 [Patescibacteria group bacterium]|nr:hypothetical protein [Patescibacteria group bacterium]